MGVPQGDARSLDCRSFRVWVFMENEAKGNTKETTLLFRFGLSGFMGDGREKTTETTT